MSEEPGADTAQGEGWLVTEQTQSSGFSELIPNLEKRDCFWSLSLPLIFDTWENSGPAFFVGICVYPLSPDPSYLMTSKSGFGVLAQSNLGEIDSGWGKLSSAS